MSSADFHSFLLRARAFGAEAMPILRVIEGIDRRNYVDPSEASLAYTNEMLTLPCGQTTDRLDELVKLIAAADIQRRHRVLEIGTGSGFTTAVLAALSERVVTVERYRSLLETARSRLEVSDFGNVDFVHGDALDVGELPGTFDRVVSTVALPNTLKVLLPKLAAGGIVIAPIDGSRGEAQVLRLEKVGLRFERHVIGSGWFPPAETGVAAIL